MVALQDPIISATSFCSITFITLLSLVILYLNGEIYVVISIIGSKDQKYFLYSVLFLIAFVNAL